MVALKSASVDFNFAQQVSLSLASIIPGILSCLGSGAVIWMISKDWERKIKKLYYRYLISLCIADLFYTFWLIAWPLPIPVDTPGIWGAVGNYRSCNIQGFVFVAGGLITSFYTCALSHYFYCSICYNMTDAQIAGRYERWIHLFIAIYSLGVCIFLFIGDYYAYTAIGCHIAAYPFDCRETDGLDCIRGQHASEVSTLTVGLPNAMIGLYIIYTMTSIYRKVHAVSKRAQLISFHAVQHQFSTVELHPPSSENLDAANSSDKHTPSRNSPNAKSDLVQETYSAGKDVVEDQRVENEQTSATDRQKEGSVHATPSSKMEEGHLPQPIQAGTSSIETQQTRRRASFMGQSEEARSSVDVHSQRTRESAWQAFFYISYYAISRIIAGVLMNMIGFSVQVPFFLMFLYYVVWPVQGFWNAFVFVRPRVKAYRHEHPEASYWAAFRHVFTSA